MYSLIH